VAIAQVVPYEVLEDTTWTVKSLVFNVNDNLSKRLPLKDLAEVNKHRFSNSRIKKEEIYKYVEVGSISGENGLVTRWKEVKGGDLPKRAKLMAREGDILLSTIRPDNGLVAIVPRELDKCLVSSGLAVLSPKNTPAEMLYFILRSSKVREEFGLLATGSTTPRLSFKQLKEYAFPAKPFTEGMYDEARGLYKFWAERIKAQKSLQEIVEDTFRQELILEEIRECQDTSNHMILKYSDLKEKLHVRNYLSPPLSQGARWNVQEKQLGDLINQSIVGASVPPEEYSEEGNTPYVRIGDLKDDKVNVSTSNLVYIGNKSTEENKRFSLLKDDVVVARIGATVGKSALVQKELEGAINSQYLIAVKCSEEIIPEYLLYFLKTSWGKNQIVARAVGSAQKYIKIQDLRELTLPAPDIVKQRDIIARVREKIKNNDLTALRQQVTYFSNSLIYR